MTLQELITDLKAAGANENILRLAMNCYKLGHQNGYIGGWSDADAAQKETSLFWIEEGKERERNRIFALLKGIDQTENESEHGWWETSVGANFGAEILASIYEEKNK